MPKSLLVLAMAAQFIRAKGWPWTAFSLTLLEPFSQDKCLWGLVVLERSRSLPLYMRSQVCAIDTLQLWTTTMELNLHPYRGIKPAARKVFQPGHICVLTRWRRQQWFNFRGWRRGEKCWWSYYPTSPNPSQHIWCTSFQNKAPLPKRHHWHATWNKQNSV